MLKRGDVAQLEEHLLCKQGGVGSSPIISTMDYLIALFIGVVAVSYTHLRAHET